MTDSTDLTRISVPKLDSILGKKFPVLNNGFIRVIDYLGNDSSIVQAARVSYGKGTKKRSQDTELIRYLIRHRHTSPFEMCELKLHVRVPMDVWRQWIRHRTASVNEYSTRYSIAIDAAVVTDPDSWRTQDFINRQGSAGFLDKKTGSKLSDSESEFQNMARELYNDRIDTGVAREQARKDLPLSTYTEAYWKIDLHNLLHFLHLRMKLNAQYEIREYANTIGEKIVAKWVPTTWQAFLDYRMNSLMLSAYETEILSLITAGKKSTAISKLVSDGYLKLKNKKYKPNLEAMEFESKLESLKIPIPWR